MANNFDVAMATWAEEAGCSEITQNGSEFARVWVFSGVVAVALLMCLVVPFIWCRPHRSAAVAPMESLGGVTGASTKRTVAEAEEDLQKVKPDLDAAKRHLLFSSATVDGRWLSPFSTGLEMFSSIGGTGTELYFTMLRTMGYLYATMAAITFPTMAFCLLGTFAPDTGQFLARASIGNLGLYVDTTILDPLLRVVRVRCDALNLADLTSTFAWLDFAAVFILFFYLVRFRFYEIPRRVISDDLESVSVEDFAVVVDKLPQRIENHKEYHKLLSQHLEQRIRAVQADGEKRGKVCDITLVRDFQGRLAALQEQARRNQQVEILEAHEKTSKVQKLKNKIDKVDQELDKRLGDEDELPTLRAYVICNTVADVDCLLYDYRLANFSIFRCCQGRAKRFQGSAIRVRKAPQPTDILWENQDTPWWSRLLRQICMMVTFILILVLSLVLIYVITVLGKSQAGSQLSYIGSEQCDPMPPDNSSESQYKCLVNVAANWTRSYAETQGGDILNCWCESQGYAKMAEDTTMLKTCTGWLLNLGKSIGIMTAASCVVVVINLVLQWVLIAMARFERPLSITALNQSMMQKIFLSQTLNTGFVLFVVNTYGPDALRSFVQIIPGLGNLLFRGPFQDLTRAWYVIVGATIMTNMLLNMITPPAITITMILLSKIQRCLFKGSAKHHYELIQLYTNPEFDIKAKYAQLLTTTFVTLTYSSGLPLLYLLGFGYTALMYWADKISLLWYSKRPPQYDALLAKESSEAMLYACALHCIFAVLMFGQPCVFPTRQVGGDLGALLQQNGGDASSALGINTGISERLTQETTWMFVAFFALLLALWVFWWLKVIFAETFGTAASMCWSLCCAAPKPKEEIITTPAASDAGLDGTLRSVTSKTSKSSKKDVDVAESMTWKEAEEIIERVAPPACYHWWRHPDQAEIAHHMKAQVSRKTRSNAPDLPVPQPAGQSFGKAMDG